MGHWGFAVIENGNAIECIEGNTSLDFSKPISVTILNRSPSFVVYLNSSLVTLYNTQEEYSGPFSLDFIVSSNFIPTETLTLELDNIKIWDLDKIEY